MSEVARRLGIGRSTLYRKLREMGIDDDQAGAA
jgi:transcriptional regulator of acetoin/glycerol metabolism